MHKAERLIRENLQTKATTLSLNNLNLTGKEPFMALLAQCTHLTNLRLWDTRIVNLVSIADIKSLTSLWLWNSQTTDLTPLKELKNLTELHLWDKQISDLAPLKELKNLKALDVMGNQISDLAPLKKLKSLTFLSLRENQITEIGLDLLDSLPNLEELYLAGNPIENIPEEIFNKKNEYGSAANVLREVRDYLESVEGRYKTRMLNEAKLIFVGVGEVGKTELVAALSAENYAFNPKRDSTQGIAVTAWKWSCLRDGEKQDFRANIWDFAGQEINYGTHQFFLTKNSLYVFVWETRKNEAELQFDYWLKVVSLLSHDAPILVVQNKIDVYASGIDERYWLKEFPNIVGFFKTSCKTGEGIDTLRDEIQKRLTALPTTREIWNADRFKVRRLLESRQDEHITYSEYLRLCAENNLPRDKAAFLAEQLHNLGVILHFADNIDTKETVVLQSSWATVAAYRLIDNKRVTGGRFEAGELYDIWQEARFDGKHGFLLRLMERFELVFRFHDSQHYIVPEGLPIAPQRENLPTAAPALRFEYHYDFMPKSILSRFTCRTHQHIEGENFWKFGVVLEHEGETRAQVIHAGKVIRAEIWGKQASKLLAVIRAHIEHINRTLKNPPLKKKIPCKCRECAASEKPYLHDYETLLKFQEKGRVTRECAESADAVPIETLLEGIERPSNVLDIEKALTHLRKANTQGYFSALDKIVPSNLEAMFNQLKEEFIADKYGSNFSQRLETFAQKLRQTEEQMRDFRRD